MITTTYGSVKPLQRPDDLNQLAREAREDHAGPVIREAGLCRVGLPGRGLLHSG
jgi:hypothetical protein